MEARDATADVLARIDRARERREWSEMATRLKSLAERLPARLELLARSVLDLLDDEEFDLAAQVWAHLQDASIIHAGRVTPIGRLRPAS
jgi:hypothetical protein